MTSFSDQPERRISPSAKVPDADAEVLLKSYQEDYEAGQEWRRAADSQPEAKAAIRPLTFWAASEIHFQTKYPESQMSKLAFQAGWERP